MRSLLTASTFALAAAIVCLAPVGAVRAADMPEYPPVIDTPEPLPLPAAGEPDPATPEGDPDDCAYWRYCAIDGFLASCCGGTHLACPPGTEMSPLTWIGTCQNPVDGKHYVVSYNDCCGKNACGRCFCHRNEGDKPVYVPPKSNDIDWCMGRVGVIYNSTVAVVIGVSTEKG